MNVRGRKHEERGCISSFCFGWLLVTRLCIQIYVTDDCLPVMETGVINYIAIFKCAFGAWHLN
jgi:hypothetical protein